MFGKFVHPCIEVCQELFLIYVNQYTRKMLCMVTGVYCYPNTCWFQYLLIRPTFSFHTFYLVMVTNIVFWTPQCLCLWWWCWNGCLCCIAVELFGGIEMHVSHFAQICVRDKYVKV